MQGSSIPQRHPQRPARRGRLRLHRFVLSVMIIALASAMIFWVHGRGSRTGAANAANTTQRQTTNTVAGAGLTRLLDSIVKAKGDYAIAVVAPGGLAANANGDKKFEAASTYKLFIAYAIFQQINSGAMKWSDEVFDESDAKQCFELMIVQSDNNCTYAFGDEIGWEAIDDMMDRVGLHNTQVKYFDNITTANDLALYLTKLQNGTLLNAADTQQLLGYMKRQQYRQGIPAGTGVTVADKVGFLDGLFHDAGIVYGPKSTYVLVILSDGSSWDQLADAAKQIHTYLQQ